MIKRVIQFFNSKFPSNERWQSHNRQSSAGCVNTSSKDVEADPCNGLLLASYFLPEEVLIHLLSFVDPHSLVFRCSFVCKRWRDIITDSRVWKMKMKIPRSKFYALSKYSDNEIKDLTVNYPWYLFYWILENVVPFERNLLRNNSSDQKILKHRRVSMQLIEQLVNGYWIIDTQPVYAEYILEGDNFDNDDRCFFTSFPPCSKQLLINLLESGFPRELLDEFQPPITISEWYTGRYDCISFYSLKIRLLDEDRREILRIPSIQRKRKQCQGQEWTKMTVKIRKYGKGLRYIMFGHRRNDSQFWAGNRGSKMAGAVVKISLPEVKGTNDEVSGEEHSITIF